MAFSSDDVRARRYAPLSSDAGAEIRSFVAAIPKVELHVHLLGSADASTIARLAGRHPERGVPSDPAAVANLCRFTSFAHFVRVYTAVNRLVTTGSDVVDLVTALGAKLAIDNVRYAEVTVTPLSHLKAGIDSVELAEALAHGRRKAAGEHAVELAWVFDVAADDGLTAGMATVDWVLAYQPPGTVGFGLGGPEDGTPRGRFREPFQKARAAGLHSVPHAGETTGPGAVWAAISHLGAERIGHGIRSVEDPRLLDHLAENVIPLEVCVTSNVRTGAVRSFTSHPLPRLLAAGIPVTLGSDDPAMFATTLSQEYLRCHQFFGLSARQLADIARAGVRAAFCPEKRRRELIAEIDSRERACWPPGASSRPRRSPA